MNLPQTGSRKLQKEMKKNNTRDIERILNAECEFHISEGFKEKTLAKAAKEEKAHPSSGSRASRPILRIAFSGLAIAAILTAALMFTAPATIPAYAAEKLFAKASEYLSNTRGYMLSIKVRTGRDENFSYTNPAYSFVVHKMAVADDGRWRLDKDGRSAEFDGKNVWVWYPDKEWGRKMDGELQSAVLEHFSPFLDLKGMMSFLESYASSREDVRLMKSESGEKVSLRLKAPAIGDFTDGYGRNSSIEESNTRQTYVFDSSSGRLESLRIDILVLGFMPRTIMKLETIQYGPTITESDFSIPVGIEWIDRTTAGLARKAATLPFNDFKDIPAEEAVTRMVAAMQVWDEDRLGVILGEYPLHILEKQYSGCRLIDCGEAFTSGIYAGVFVPCRLQYPDGRTGKLRIALRNDNRYGIWMVDGGI